jgi:hypothetical protein
MRMLKCPSCRRQSAWLTFGIKRYEDNTHRHFKQKKCNCGYEGKPTYRNYQPDADCFYCQRMAEYREAQNKEA